MLFQLPGSLPLIGCLCCLPLVVSYDNGAPGSRLPVMGWSSWVALGPAASHPIFDYCDEASVKHAADALVSLGLRDAGYRGFHLDDCWADVKRNGSGTFRPNWTISLIPCNPSYLMFIQKGWILGCTRVPGAILVLEADQDRRTTQRRTQRYLPSGRSIG